MYDDNSPAYLVTGYGASRRVETPNNIESFAQRNKSRRLRYQRVASLFEEHFALIPLSAWLPHLKQENPGRYKQVCTLVNKLLPDGAKFTGRREGNDYIFQHRGVPVPFTAMSDGYRSYIGWIGDLLYHICMGCPRGMSLMNNRGLVLIDEIDLHLHPRWQREIIPKISRQLPKLQFIMTTHSPVVAGTLHHCNTFVLKEDLKGSVIVEPLLTSVHGLNADQILLTGAFGLQSSRANEFMDKIQTVSTRLQEGDPDAGQLLSRMMIEGSRALVEQEQVAEPAPAWAHEAAQSMRAKRPREPKSLKKTLREGSL
ncbi:MAG: AAA family ATPase [Planctomycetes bacterium]|nr:AAA family ATPase [Planctomycetota bacterium]